jgi:hypothetical protein
MASQEVANRPESASSAIFMTKGNCSHWPRLIRTRLIFTLSILQPSRNEFRQPGSDPKVSINVEDRLQVVYILNVAGSYGERRLLRSRFTRLRWRKSYAKSLCRVPPRPRLATSLNHQGRPTALTGWENINHSDARRNTNGSQAAAVTSLAFATLSITSDTTARWAWDTLNKTRHIASSILQSFESPNVRGRAAKALYAGFLACQD